MAKVVESDCQTSLNKRLIFKHRLAVAPTTEISLTLSLTADERSKTRRYVEADDGTGIYLQLPRGTTVRHGDVLATTSTNGNDCSDLVGPQDDRGRADSLQLLKIIARPEPVMTVSSDTPLDLIKAAYHLGNRHVAVEVNESYLRLSPDPVLKTMLTQMGFTITEDELPFEPESGAYGHHHH